MVRKAILVILFVVLVIPAAACGHGAGHETGHMARWNDVDVRIVSDGGSEFAKYRTHTRVPRDGKYFYVEAVKGDRYSIQVTNRSDRRIGLVIAVDGRNIVSGKKSDLARNERMYVIGPYETNTFEGWRTGMDRTNRFYFTEQSDSYAEKVFADASAMGTIALAVYREKLPEVTQFKDTPMRMKEAPSAAAPRAAGESGSADRAEAKTSEQAGTGFGETTHSPARVVEFEPERTVVEKIVMKYEWRSELCKKGIISGPGGGACGPANRFWPEHHEFAPIPRDFRG
jgi:hypothetical protein